MLTVVAYCVRPRAAPQGDGQIGSLGTRWWTFSGPYGQVMHEWVNVQVPRRAAAAGATVENGGMYIYRDEAAMSTYSEPLLNGLRS